MTISAFSNSFRALLQRRYSSNYHKLFNLSSEVAEALAQGKPVVALESTLITHGLPFPCNLEVSKSLEKIIRKKDVTPATIALYEGRICVGLDDKQLESIAQPKNQPIKASRRDIPNVLAEHKIGGTTVAATMWIAHQVGIKIFSTGGIGGVHRGAELNFDISADLIELGRTPVAVVCTGAKSILDIPKTLEVLETHSVNCIAYDDYNLFPGFFTRRTSWKAAHNTNSLKTISDILACSEQLGLQNGTLIACPLPEEFAKESEMVEKAVEIALQDAKKANISNKETTPFLLKRINELTGSASLRINIALLENNARIAAELAHIHHSCLSKPRLAVPSTNTVSPNMCSGSFKKREVKKPKVLVVGASICDFETITEVEHAFRDEGAYHPGQIYQRAGGVARNHADALNRLDCEATLISIIGKDRFADFLREKCPPNMDWTHAFTSTESTATSMTLNVGGNVKCGFLNIDNIMAQLSPEMISSKKDLFETADFVLLDANLRDDSTACVLQLAKQFHKKVWFEPTNFLKVHKLFGKDALWKSVNVISPNANEFRVMCQHLRIHLPENILSNAESLTKFLSRNQDVVNKMFLAKLEHLLITIDKTGCVMLTKKDDESVKIRFITPPTISKMEVVSVSGAGDCFNCGLLSSLLHDCGLEKSLETAKDCAKKSLKSIDAVPESLFIPV